MRAAFALAFEQWLKDYQAAPSKFDAESLSTKAPRSYGERAADTLIEYLDTLAAGRPWNEIGAAAEGDLK